MMAEKLYQAWIEKNTEYEGLFFVGVTTTGVFCRSICPEKKPKFEHCEFFETAEAALLASYRPCKCCKPLSHPSKARCAWVTDNPIYIDYHDNEWGVPIYDDRLLFEFLILEGMQAGLNWLTILKKRDNFRKCFDNFDAEIMANYDQNKILQLMGNAGIIRNRLKIQAAIVNAQAFLRIRKTPGDFSDYIWGFMDGAPLQNHWEQANQVPTTTLISDAMSTDLKKKGFKFTGSTICYAFMQAVGMVNDHTINCFCYKHKD